MKKIKLGSVVRDRITGLEGVVIARTEYHTGCIHIGIQAPVDSSGRVPSLYWTDEVNLSMKPEAKKKRGRTR